MGPLTKALLAAHAIPLDPQIPSHSVQRIISDPSLDASRPRNRTSSKRSAPIPPPPILKKKTRTLKKLRASDVWKSGTRDQQVAEMDEWFPDLENEGEVGGGLVLRGKKMLIGDDGSVFDEDEVMDLVKCAEEGDFDVNMEDFFSSEDSNTTAFTGPCPVSDIGNLYRLPGELRNGIYRMVMLQQDSKLPIRITLPAGTCSTGTCIHTKASANLPGIASTCKQLRWEAAPIFFTENVAGFEFDDGTVQQCCVGNYLRSLGSYVDMIPKFSFLLKRPIWRGDTFVRWGIYRFTLISPKTSESEDFELKQEEVLGKGEMAAGKICDCPLRKIVGEINGSLFDSSIGDLVLQMVDSEEFADFVWRVKKTKQHVVHLRRCKQCKEVIFNN